MSKQNTDPLALMAKAETACSSAKVLLRLGDTDGAASRAYYAMFDAARAALLLSNAPVDAAVGRTHSGLIGSFSRFLVKDGPVPKEIGRSLNLAHEVRLLADYNGDSVEIEDAARVVEQAEAFVSVMKALFVRALPGESARG